MLGASVMLRAHHARSVQHVGSSCCIHIRQIAAGTTDRSLHEGLLLAQLQQVCAWKVSTTTAWPLLHTVATAWPALQGRSLATKRGQLTPNSSTSSTRTRRLRARLGCTNSERRPKMCCAAIVARSPGGVGTCVERSSTVNVYAQRPMAAASEHTTCRPGSTGDRDASNDATTGATTASCSLHARMQPTHV